MKNTLHCCEDMETFITSNELAVIYNNKFREYGIRYTDGGTSYQIINYCPWCGKKLPESLRDKWFDEIESQGFDPDDPNLPKKYLSDEWFKN